MMASATGASMTMKLEADESLTIAYVQDVEPILKLNEFSRNELATSHFSRKGDLHKVASVPEVVVYLWKKLYGFDLLKFHPNNQGDQAMLRRLLNDNDWLKLRTSPGVF